ncbi:MAG: acetylornithine/succinylornithine family transaminase [Treponema sp.]|nr:acetylornithine/succinylornithine family transaminase [Treponema sp.]
MANKGNIANNYGSLDAVFVSGKGATLKDIKGKQYVDFVSGIGVNCLGHNHPKLVKALKKQVKKQIHISNYYNSDMGLAFAKELLIATDMKGVFFGNSGAEANEAAIKLARKFGSMNATNGKERKTIVTLQKSFHGRTVTTLRATGQDKFHAESFAPYPEGFKHIVANDYDSLKVLDDSVCAVLIECVQGEGGVNLIDAKWAQALQKATHDCGALFMVDEVQTGIGRTGTFLASEWLGLKPDVISLAKGIAAGIPMGACLFGGKATDVFVAGDHQSTFGGNPIACCAGRVVLSEVNTPQFLARVSDAGEKIINTIKEWDLSCIKEIRGKGLMIGIDIEQSAPDVQKWCLAHGLCVSTAGANTIRFLPPLIITNNEIEVGLRIFYSALTNI